MLAAHFEQASRNASLRARIARESLRFPDGILGFNRESIDAPAQGPRGCRRLDPVPVQ